MKTLLECKHESVCDGGYGRLRCTCCDRIMATDDNNKQLAEARKQAITEFESMRDMTELRALSKHSLEHPVTNAQYERMMYLKNKVFGGEQA